MKKPVVEKDEPDEAKRLLQNTLNSTDQDPENKVIIFDESRTIRINEHETEYEITNNYNIRGRNVDKKKISSQVN